MQKCNIAKNPCKICWTPVSTKNGLQCQGACETWVHFDCLNYTPGKIKDIKAGIIKVVCPCPDCKTALPKEYRTDQPFSCVNTQCPANRDPKCNNERCPLHGGGGPRSAPPCPLSSCGTACKKHSTPQMPGAPRTAAPPCIPSEDNVYAIKPAAVDGCSHPIGLDSETGSPLPPSGGGKLGTKISYQMVAELCNTVGELTLQINDLMSQMKTLNSGKQGGGSCCSRGGSNTMVVNIPDGGGACPARKGRGNRNAGEGTAATCGHSNPKQVCPKPCFCARNPIRKGPHR